MSDFQDLGSPMRDTLTSGDDGRDAARHLAELEQRTVGEVISSLARQALVPGLRASRNERNGIPLLPNKHGESPVTLELVNQLRDEQP